MNDTVELRHLRYFIAVAEELHFGRAARRLHMAQPPLSQQIRQLESILGHRLFERTSRAVRLTPAGMALLERARRTLDRLHDDLAEVRRVGRGETGSLTVGFVSSAMLTSVPAILRRYRVAFPAVELRLREMYTTNLSQALQDGSVDVGFLRDGGEISELHVETVLAEPYIVVLPRRHRLAGKQVIAPGELRNEALVLFPRSVGPRAWDKTEQVCTQAGFRLPVVQEAPQWVTILRLVGAGMGITIAPDCIQTLARADVVCRKVKPCMERSDLELAYRHGPLPPTATAFCELARMVLQSTSTHGRTGHRSLDNRVLVQ